jgi:hypothetical protein
MYFYHPILHPSQASVSLQSADVWIGCVIPCESAQRIFVCYFYIVLVILIFLNLVDFCFYF